MTVARFLMPFAVVVLTAAPALASTHWIINDADRDKAVRLATEQAMQKARTERSCYLPAVAKMCRRESGLWSCTAENPAKASSCGKRGRWRYALPAG